MYDYAHNTTLTKPEICIWVDKYEDVFSDFDTRSLADRTLSVDFLREVHKMSIDNTVGDIKLKFHVLGDESNTNSEEIIKAKINGHYKQIADKLLFEKKQIMQKGYTLLGAGFVVISFIFLLTVLFENSTYMHGFILMLEPIGWFTTWTGLDNLFQNSKKANPELDFNTKMAAAEVEFISFSAPQGTTEATEKTEQKQKSVIPLDSFNLRVA